MLDGEGSPGTGATPHYHYGHVRSGKDDSCAEPGGSGFFCVDNLPPVLIPKFAELIEQSNGKIGKVALVIDLRGREFFTALSESLNYIKDHFTIHCEISLLDATDSVLVQRYKESRRRHPLAPEGMPLDGIKLSARCWRNLKISNSGAEYQHHEAGSIEGAHHLTFLPLGEPDVVSEYNVLRI